MGEGLNYCLATACIELFIESRDRPRTLDDEGTSRCNLLQKLPKYPTGSQYVQNARRRRSSGGTC